MNSASQPQDETKESSFWFTFVKAFRHFPRLFDRLHWKLTLSYTLVSVLVAMVLVALVSAGFLWFYSYFYYANIPDKMAETAELIAPYFLNESSTEEKLSAWLETQKSFLIVASFDGEVIEFDLNLDDLNQLHFLDTQMRLLATTNASLQGSSKLELNQTEEAMLASVLAGNSVPSFRLSRRFPFRLFNATPVILDGQVVASIVLTQDFKLMNDGLWVLGFVLLLIIVIATLIGTLFGFVSSRGITRRLERLEHVTLAWRQGDFAARVHDPSSDELGRLTARLNHMAEDLASHISTRQELAMLEERNRLALELHDSVKQQIFAIAMKLGFTESLANTDALKKALHDLGELAHQTQDELQRLIHELKPMALEREGLASALKAYTASWQDLYGLDVTQQIELLEPLPSAVEQALFRVAQESLSNIAKHAQAKHVKLSLSRSDNAIVLSIQDDGCGFNLNEVTSGLGRYSMLERMQQLGGSLDISSKVGEGTQVKARLALEGGLS